MPLFDLDEALYVSCSKQMVLSGDIVTPRLNSRPPGRLSSTVVPFFEKPILVYWACAASLRLFGVSEGAARLPVALAALLTTGLIAYAGSRWFGRRAGLLAGVVYATAPMTLIDARQMTTDGLLVLWFTVALLAFFELQSGVRTSNKSPVPPLLPLHFPGRSLLLTSVFWVACALAVLTKGAVGLLLPALVILAFLAFSRFSIALQWGNGLGLHLQMSGALKSIAAGIGRIRLLRPVIGLLLLMILVAPWHMVIARTRERDAESRTWAQEYLIRQHVGRFKGLDTVHNAPLPTYFVYFLFGFFPWSCFVPIAFRRVPSMPCEPQADGQNQIALSLEFTSNQEENAGSQHIALRDCAAIQNFLLIWFWTIFLFFTIGAAKLPTYIVPCYPAAALLTGLWLDKMIREGGKAVRWGALAAALIAGILVLATFVAPHFVPKNRPVPAEMAQALLHITILLFVGCAGAWASFRWRGNLAQGRMLGITFLAAAMMGLIAVGTSEGYSVASKLVLGPYQHMAAAASDDAKVGIPIVYYHIVPRRPSMLYYGGYSPIETKVEPLLPFLRTLFSRSNSKVDVVTAGDIYASKLQTELNAVTDIRASVLAREGTERGGWVLLRLQRAPSTPPQSNP